MSDFFAQLGSNIRFPDANINGSGPLPTSLSGPAGVNGDPDGRINFNSELLSGIAPYAYGPGQGRMGADRNYQQIPHRIQKIVPKLFLPFADESNSQSCLALSHAVDQGDVAFILQTSRVQNLIHDSITMRDASIANLQIPGHTAFINICTANYLLAGLQRLTAASSNNASWAVLARDLGYRYARGHTRADVLELVSTRLVPFGICAGSENQGGKHETGLAPVQAAANHVTTLTVDGQNRDLVNLWRNVNISAGDNLIFKLVWMPTQHYTLNHYYKGIVRQTYVSPKNCWQLVPAVFEMTSPLQASSPHHWDYDYRIHGYWRIAQCFQHRASYESDPNNICDDTQFLRGQLLQVTFAPVWVQTQPLNAPDPAKSLLGAPEVRRDRSLPHSHAQPGSGQGSQRGKRSYFEAFGLIDAAPACAVFATPATKPCELRRWFVSTSADSSAMSAFSASALALAPATAARADAVLATAAPLPGPLARGVTTTGADKSSRATDSAPVPGPDQRTAAPATLAPQGKAVEMRPTQPPTQRDATKAASVAEAISVSGRPVASMSALSSEMSTITPDAGAGAPADRTVKRVLQKSKAKSAASPPVSSPKPPA
jgi:hypothetical protein